MAEKENPEKTDPAPPPPAKKKLPLIPILGGVAFFLVCVIIFSFKYGVFSSSNVKPGTETPQKEAAKKDSTENLEATQKDKDAYDGLFSDFEDQTDTASAHGMTPKDSINQITWYEAQKKEIASQMSQVEQERAKLETMRNEVQALLDRRKQIEETNMVQMAKLYEGMNSEELVPIMANLSDAQVSGLISNMKKQKAAEILGKLPPDRAAKITQHIISMDNTP
jgi:flagellar motility protein MotE (MotC chaperone)